MADISVALELNDKQYQQAIKNAESATQKFANTAESSTEQVSRSFQGLASVVGAIGFGKLITDSLNLGKQLTSLSNATGIAIKNVKGLQDAFVAAGGTADKASDGLTDLVKNIGEAAQNGGELVGAFRKVGVSLTDLSKMSEKDIMRKVIEGLAKIPDSATRTAVGMKLMGEAVKGVDFTKVNESIDKYIEKASGIEASAKSAAEAQKNLTIAYENVQVGILGGIKPLTELIAQLTKNTEVIASFVEGATKVGIALAAWFAIGKVATLLQGFAGAVLAARTSSLAFGTSLFGQSKLISDFKDGIFLVTRSFTQFGVGTAAGVTAVSRFWSVLSIMSTGFVKMIPLIGTVVTALTAFNEVTRMITGNSALDWLQKFGEKLGIVSKSTDDSKKSQEEAAAAQAKANEERQRALEFLQKEKEALNQQVAAYQNSNNEALKKLKLETELIGKGEAYKKTQQELAAAETQYLSEIIKLKDQYAKAQSPEQQAQISAAMQQLTTEYSKQRDALTATLAAQEKKIQANNLEKFSIDSLISNNQQLQSIYDQIATLSMPALEKGYYNLEAAARKSAEAAIAAENARRGKGNEMSKAEEAKYYEAAAQGIQKMKDATEELAAAEAKRERSLAAIRERLEIEKQIRDVQSEMATMTMSEIEKKEHDIKRAAEERARAYIAAEEARTGVKIDSAEQQRIIDEYISGTKDLVDATKKSYDMSRTFATGWKQAMNDYVKQAGDGAAKAKSIFAKAMSGMEDLLVQFAKTGKFEWRNFVAMMLEELLRAQIQVIFAQMLGDMTDAFRGSASGGLGGLLGGGTGGQQGGGNSLLGSIGNLLTGGNKQGTGTGTGGSSGGILGSIWDGVKNFFSPENAPGDGMGPTKPAGTGYTWLSDIGSGVGDFWNSMTSGASDWWSSASDTFSSWGSAASDWTSGAWDAIGDWGSSAGSWAGDALSGIGDLFGGFFADGGNLGAGKWGIAGEAGPEIIHGPATITPMSDISSGGGSTNVTYNINAVDAKSFKQMLAQDPSYLYGLTMMGANGISGRR